jgi:CubicO group peptidase (beta-lactamase class C family)
MTILSDKVQALLDTATADPSTGIPGIVFVAVDKNGQTLTSNASGVRSLDTKTPMTPDTVLWLASGTKLITAIATMQLVEQGKLRLDDAEQVVCSSHLIIAQLP